MTVYLTFSVKTKSSWVLVFKSRLFSKILTYLIKRTLLHTENFLHMGSLRVDVKLGIIALGRWLSGHSYCHASRRFWDHFPSIRRNDTLLEWVIEIGRDQWIQRTCWSATLAEMISSRFSDKMERDRNKMERDRKIPSINLWFLPGPTQMVTYTTQHTQVHVWDGPSVWCARTKTKTWVCKKPCIARHASTFLVCL